MSLKKREGVNQEHAIESVVERLVRMAEETQKIVSNTDYMDWLYEFTIAYPSFTTGDWDYKEPKGITDDEYARVNMLTYLFDAIHNYCDDNMLKAGGKGNCAEYVVNYSDASFVIGVCVGQGAFNYVERINGNCALGISFEDILTGKKDEKLDAKKQKLDKLEELLKELKKLEIPYYEVSKVVKKVF